MGNPKTGSSEWTWAERRRWAARMRWRSATRRWRVLPDFLVLGGQRCGSTSLYDMLCGHPDVAPASHKEPHFFDNNHLRGEEFYRRLFPLQLQMRARERRQGRRAVTGEATTYYLAHPAVPARVRALLPDVRLIAILRDPVDRAYSHYQLSVREGREPLSFEEALAAEPDRLAGEHERLIADPSYRGVAHRFFSYRSRGRYIDQLERWWAEFPREQLLVLRSEDMFEDPRIVYDQLVTFLGLDPDADRRTFRARNRVSYDAMRPETRAELRGYFAEPNRALEQRTGRAFNWQAPE
ncbi:MAG TPA: sulfotransferase domain-containing protein [Gaiellales bacterium]|jgi:hypothetical protein|nr:sulfotransferase domain-containing protein [Gaiellales bacterium]